ncbi:hypothetical protein DICA4_F07426 [Diutina catenulata]
MRLLTTIWIALAVRIVAAEFDSASLAPSSFFETFDYPDLASSPWVVSTAVKAHDKKQAAYDGEWAIEESSVHPGSAKRALVIKSKASHHGISRSLPEPVSGTPLVVQYEVKAQQGLECGGAYIKLLDGGASESFSSRSPYQVMFGPDVCGANNKVHLIIRRKSPVTGRIGEKHLAQPPLARTNRLSNLYTLVIDANHYEVRINGKVANAGRLLDEGAFQPPFNPPREIPDPSDKMPDTWDDRKWIYDPKETKKPDGWDLKHGKTHIPDPNDKKPHDWLENEPVVVDDPKDVVPDDWDPEIDGEWQPRRIPNPKCAGRSGCGPWFPRKIPNPDYQSKWTRPVIDNPDYMGEWEPRKKENPAWYDDAEPWVLNPIAGVGFDLWSMEPDILFDNIYVGHSVDEAERIGNATFLPKFDAELAAKKEAQAEEERQQKVLVPPPPPPPVDELFDKRIDDGHGARAVIAKFIAHHLAEVNTLFLGLLLNPIPTIFNNFFKFIIYGGLAVMLFSLAFGVVVALAFLVSGAEQDTREGLQKRHGIEAETEEAGTKEAEEAETKKTKVVEVEGTTSATRASEQSVRARAKPQIVEPEE